MSGGRKAQVDPADRDKAKLANLRQVAEEIVRQKNASKPAKDEPIPPEEARRLLHELQVYQVELEAQNEELRRPENEWESARGRYFELFELAPVAYLTVNEARLILDANLTAANLLGVTKSLLLKAPINSFIFRDDQDSYYLFCKEQDRSDTLRACEIRMRCGDKLFWARIHRKRMWGPGGQPVFLTTISDVSDRKSVEEARQKSEARLVSILDGQTDLICRYLPDGRLSFVNEAYLRFFGKTRQELLDHNFIPHIPEGDLSVIKAKLAKISPDQPIAEFDHRVIMPSGVTYWQQWIHRGVFDPDGKLVEVQAVGRDITERKVSEAARVEIEKLILHSQKMTGLTKVAAGVAHDFNNLLAIIKLNQELATVENDRDRCLHHLQVIGETVTRATALTQKMLAYSGKGLISPGSVQVNEAVGECVRKFQADLRKALTVQLDLGGKLPPVQADEGQIHQVIMNLLINAAESMNGKPGTVKIETRMMECTERALKSARLETKPDPGLFVAIEVRDDGCGMDEEVLAHLFDPFYSTKFVGRGLGLSAVLGIVRGHRGGIMIDSTPGKGTSFKVLFPAFTEPLQVSPVQALSPVPPAECSGVVLVVDDEPLILEVCGTALRNMGITVLSASDGPEAIDLFQRNAETIHCVLLDLTMPGMNGWAVFNRLRQIKPGIRVILSSGYCEEEALSQFQGDWPESFLQKPFSTGSLKEKITRLLQEKK